MNQYMQGAVDACQALATDRLDFVRKVKLVTGLTSEGIKNSPYIMGIIKDFAK